MRQRTIAGATLAFVLLVFVLSLRMAASGAAAAVPASVAPRSWPLPPRALFPGTSTPAPLAPGPQVDLARLSLPDQHGYPRLESALVQVVAEYRAQSPSLSADAYRIGVTLDGESVRVVLQLKDADPDRVAAEAATLGAEIEQTSELWVQALSPIGALTSLTGIEGVSFVRRPLHFVSQAPQRELINQAIAYTGADAWHAAGFRGQGAKIAVLDLGFTGYEDLLGSELPKNVRTRSFARSGDIEGFGKTHGTGVAELVYDMAPDAALYLVNFATELDLERAITWMIQERMDVVVFSLGHTTGPFDGTDPIDQMVDAARAGGVLWVNAAGNQGAGHWYGEFAKVDGENWMEWAPGVRLNSITVGAGEPVFATLTWDGWPETKEDYALYLFMEVFPGQFNLISFGDTVQEGVEPPVEIVTAFGLPRGTFYFGVKRIAGTRPARLHLFNFVQKLGVPVPAHSIVIPATARGALAAGATNDGLDTLEEFSAQGPSVDGRLKPELTAPDRVDTITFGPMAFEGTSASAPLVGGAAALVLSAYPWLDPAALQGYLQERALDLGVPGPDPQFGAGRLRLGPVPTDIAPQPTPTPALPPVVPATPTSTATLAPGQPTPTRTPTRTPVPTRTATPVPTPVAWPVGASTPPMMTSGTRP